MIYSLVPWREPYMCEWSYLYAYPGESKTLQKYDSEQD